MYFESLRIKRAESGSANHNHLLYIRQLSLVEAFCPGDIPADDQAGQIGRRIFALQFAPKLTAANFKQQMDKLGIGKHSGLIQCPREFAISGNFRHAVGIHQDAETAKNIEEFSGQGGLKLLNRAILERHPFGVRPRHAEQLAPNCQARIAPKRSRYLRFFSPHHVGRPEAILTKQTGRDRDRSPAGLKAQRFGRDRSTAAPGMRRKGLHANR